MCFQQQSGGGGRVRGTALKAGGRPQPRWWFSADALPRLRPVPNGVDRNAFAAHSVENQIRSTSDREFTNPRLASSTAQVGMVFQSFDQGDDPRRQSLRSVRLVLCHVSSYLFQPCERQWRPDNL